MDSTKKLRNIQSKLNLIFAHYPIVSHIIQAIDQKGGIAYLVGGAVRDIIISSVFPVNFGAHELIQDKLSSKGVAHDIDIEVHGLQIDQLEQILRQFGIVSYVGKSFGVLKIHGIDIDWSLPRLDSSGRKPLVHIDPTIDIKTALRRRDLTMNAMALNLLTGELIDPFNGVADIEQKIIRSPDPQFFTEDPLRFYRVMQFVGRFEMTPDQELDRVCASMHILHISRERIEAEFEKLLLLSKRPSLGIRWLHKVERIRHVLPELGDTLDTQQEREWHPEGTVFEHSMQALDAAAPLSYDSEHEKLICLYAALCHDLGKVKKTQLINGRLRSHGHDVAGVPLTKKMLSRITGKKELIKSAAVLVREHMQPIAFTFSSAKPAAYKRLALRLQAEHVTIAMLAKVVLADRRGRNGCGHEPLTIDVPDLDDFVDKAQKAQVYFGHEVPILQGRDIQDLVQPGPQMGEYLKYAYDVQLDQNIQDKDILKEAIKKKFLL